jgi:SAM-dependent methyltransferase
MKLYTDLAELGPLISPPSEYAEEAAFLRGVLDTACSPPPRSVLELGSGWGNIATFLKRHFTLTLTDVAPRMLAVSRAANPDCEHVEGDLRTLRLGRQFDAVLIHDAITYMTTADDLRAAARTAYEHLRPGGAAILVPDEVSETFSAGAELHGGDGPGRSVRYIEWSFDPDPSDTTYQIDYVVLIRDGAGELRIVHDRQVGGLFPREVWLSTLRDVGFDPAIVTDDWGRDVFVARRP